MGVPVFKSIRTLQFYCEERVVGENEQSATVNAAKDDINRTLWHVDLADQFPRWVVDENLPVGNIHIAFAVDGDALTAALSERLEVTQRAVGSDPCVVGTIFRCAADIDPLTGKS